MLQPKRTKYRKLHKGRNRGLAAGCKVSFGEIGLQAVTRCRMTARQIESARRAMTRHVKRQGKYGFVFFLISQLLPNLLKSEWVKVKVELIIG